MVNDKLFEKSTFLARRRWFRGFSFVLGQWEWRMEIWCVVLARCLRLNVSLVPFVWCARRSMTWHQLLFLLGGFEEELEVLNEGKVMRSALLVLLRVFFKIQVICLLQVSFFIAWFFQLKATWNHCSMNIRDLWLICIEFAFWWSCIKGSIFYLTNFCFHWVLRD